MHLVVRHALAALRRAVHLRGRGAGREHKGAGKARDNKLGIHLNLLNRRSAPVVR
jgi:hypothetical protein